MAIFRCKMCGGDLVIDSDSTVCECEYCGSKQTVPTVQDEGLQGLFNRANVLRMKSEFDKAAEIYEKILQRSETEAEAYWGLILCKYGIEYVEDPQTFRRVPTCHRASYDAVTADEDYRRAIQYADPGQKALYEQQAAEIDAIQKGIIALAQKEDPYDVFICYKETGEDGKRTQDSVIANDIYHQLTLEGFKVFYAPITLENKLGSEYEPYIFSALNTAKVMLALGTKPEYFNAVWVKNEWSRFLKIMKKDRTKLLIPCFRDMDPYELPEEFSHLQAQDMSKIGFISDLVRGIKKVIAKDSTQPQTKETVVVQQSGSGTTAGAQVKRGNMALEDGEWDKADAFFEEALNLDPECAEAYLGKLLAREKKANFDAWLTAQKLKYASQTTERLEACPADSAHVGKKTAECALPGYLDEQTIRKLYDYDRGYDSALSCRKAQKTRQLRELDSERLLTRAKQYAKGDVQKQIENGFASITAALDQRIEQAQNEDTSNIARVKSAYAAYVAEADKKADVLNADAQKQQEAEYQSAVAAMKAASDVPGYKKAVEALNAMNSYKDSKDLTAQCEKEIERLEEEARQEAERQAAIKKKEAKRKAKKAGIISAISVTAVIVCVAIILVIIKVAIPNSKYNAAVKLMESGDYDEAIAEFEATEGYKDSADQIEACYYGINNELIEQIKNLEVGDTFLFGSYEQNNNSDSTEDIEWILLAVQDNQALVVSENALDCQQYNIGTTNVTWETCSLRNWLNNDFYNVAFSDSEKAIIATSDISVASNNEYNVDPGNDTQDKVFVLSSEEAEEYFSDNDSRTCEASSYAIAQGAGVADGSKACSWWLRSLGSFGNCAASVGNDGIVNHGGRATNVDNYCVRPAMWINLDY